jgi:hypothetical protein
MRLSACWLILIGFSIVGCGRKPSDANLHNDQPIPPNSESVPDQAASLYGDVVDETAIAAASAPPFSVMRPRKDDSTFRLSNARFVPIGEKPNPLLRVDYEWVNGGKHNGQSLVVHRADGRTQTFHLLYPLTESRGTIEINLGIAPPGQTHPKDAELYLTRNDSRWGPHSPTFKVSNSTFMGTFDEAKRTPVRGWTKEEFERLSQPPPAYATPNTTDGTDTKFAGDTTGGGSFRYVDPNGHVIGVHYTLGSWDGVACIANASPIFSADQPTIAGTRVMAKSGYAVGGVEVQTKKFVTAMRLIYFAVKPDGTLDATSKLTSDWFGHPDPEREKTAVTLGGDGKTVIGIHQKKGAILNGIALVVKE